MKYLSSLCIGLCFFLLLLNCLELAFPLEEVSFRPSSGRILRDRAGIPIRQYPAPDGYFRYHLESEDIPKRLIDCVLFSEDQYFYWHPGVNPFSIARAFLHNLFSSSVVGGSTLTMQIARMMDRAPRTYKNKIIEIFRAIQLEMKYSKKELLEIYLNLAPYGGNLEGIRAASLHYYDREPQYLSLAQMAALTVIPRAPNSYRPDRCHGLKEATSRLLTSIYESGEISKDELTVALKEEICTERNPVLIKHPHFTALRSVKDVDSFLAVNSPLQSRLENALKMEVYRVSKARPLKNAALLLMNAKTGEILTWIGSQNYWDNQRQGQIDGVTVPRSPGSLLKPFLYGLSLDQGLIKEKTLLPDMPMHLSGYTVENFYGSYQGLVPANEALQLSLNTPFFFLNSRLFKGDDLYTLISKLSSVRPRMQPKEYYGASLVLGGLELNLLEMVTLYSAFVNGGRIVSPTVLKNDTKSELGSRLLSEGSSWIAASQLSQVYSGSSPLSTWKTKERPFAIKTGTSSGYRDFWVMGFNQQIVMGLWMGNFDHSSCSYGASSEVAVPVFLKLLNLLPVEFFKDLPKEIPATVSQSKECIFPAVFNSDCERSMEDMFILKQAPAMQCSLYSPSYLKRVIDSGAVSLQSIRAVCPEIKAQTKPEITLPGDGASYRLSSLIPLEQQSIPLECWSFHESILNLTINGKILDTVSSGERKFYPLSKGQYTLDCIADDGSSDTVQFVINDGSAL